MKTIRMLSLLIPVVALGGCGLDDAAKNLGDLLFGGGGKIPRQILGVQNELRNNPKGTFGQQMQDIRFTLGLRHVRSSFAFDESYLPSEGAAPNFSRFDAILAAVPEEVDLLPILAYAPSWLANRPDWKTVFVNDYVIPCSTVTGVTPGSLAGRSGTNRTPSATGGLRLLRACFNATLRITSIWSRG